MIDPDLLKRYQSIVGALLYCATNTRPDVAYAVGMLCRAMGKPTLELYDDALRVLRYLRRTKAIGLRYKASQRPLHKTAAPRAPQQRRLASPQLYRLSLLLVYVRV